MPFDLASLGCLEQSLINLFKDLQDGQLADAIALGKHILHKWSQEEGSDSLDNVLIPSNWKRQWQRNRSVPSSLFRELQAPDTVSVFGLNNSASASIKWRSLLYVFIRILEFAWNEDEDAAPRLRSAIREYFSLPGSVLSLKARSPSNAGPTIISLGDRLASFSEAGQHGPPNLG